MTRVLGARLGLAVLLVLGGCGSSWSDRFPVGSRLYELPSHHYFGKVVGFAAAHDFQIGVGAKPAILIEQADGGAKVWGACETCAASMQIEPPPEKRTQ